MLIKMENSAAVSGRRRGTTKHSVEDQALDQIAKEKIVNIGGDRQLSGEEDDAGVVGMPSEAIAKEWREDEGMEEAGQASGENPGAEEFSSSDDSFRTQFYEDISEKDSDDEETKYQKILVEVGKGVETDNLKFAEGRPDKTDNVPFVVSDNERSNFEKACGNFTEVDTEGSLPSAEEGSLEGGGLPESPGDDSAEFSDESALSRIGAEEDGQTEPHLVAFLGKENCKAEARLAARRQARAEAREIRLRELERQQKESEENADKVFDMSLASENILRTGRVAPISGLMNAKDRPAATANSYHSSRRSSEDSVEDGPYCLRDMKHELKELDEKFRKAMIANAQLDNEKSELTYQVELLKDRLEDLEETHAQLSRECREKTREHEQLKRVAVKLKEELFFYKSQLEERDKLISDYGLVIVGGEGEEGGGTSERVLVSKETAELLEQAGDGTLDVRLKKLADERNELLDEVRHLKLELEEERNKKRLDGRSGYGGLTNGPLDEETSKLLSDYRFKLQKAEQDVSTLQANVARLESQVIRYKSAAESSEKAEDELKIEKRKLQRENRESIARIEELETANSHLMRRMDKLKNAKSTLLKEL